MPTSAAVPGSIIRLHRVTKRFPPDVTALNGVDISVAPGEVVVLLGLSGSGKSTLLRHVDGLHRPTSGSVTVLGTDVSTAGAREIRQLRRRVGFVFQQFNLVGRLTVLENVCSGALGRLRGPRLGLFTYPTAVRRAAREHLDRVGLNDQVFQRADTLSGGQQQRVAVARALMQRPEILLADEPVASLDPESAQTVMRLIRDIAREQKLTVMCSLHQIEMALSWADRVIGLRMGEVVMQAATDQLDKSQVMVVYEKVSSPLAELAGSAHR